VVNTPDTPRSRSNPETRRQQILDEAVRIIGECGYNSFSIRALATRCKLTNAGLLHYFGSKESLLVAVLEERAQRDSGSIHQWFETRDASESTADGLKRAKAALRALIQRSSEQPQIVRLSVILGAESLQAGHPARDYFIKKERDTISSLRELLDTCVDSPEQKAKQLVAALYGLGIQWVRAEHQFNLAAEWELLMNDLLPAPHP